MYAAFDINGGLMVQKKLGMIPFFYHRYIEFILHWTVGICYGRWDHIAMGCFHAWKYWDVKVGIYTAFFFKVQQLPKV